MDADTKEVEQRSNTAERGGEELKVTPRCSEVPESSRWKFPFGFLRLQMVCLRRTGTQKLIGSFDSEDIRLGIHLILKKKVLGMKAISEARIIFGIS